MKNASISLGNYFDQFVSSQVSAGRYKNASEVLKEKNKKNLQPQGKNP